ncbi:MAG: hypothetical protein JNJ91_07835 [Flavobacteriales bacterium]|nr:hypothetical protein [Flavobacteriales bacterium]
MAIDIQGWIEVCRRGGEECQEEHSWSGVVNLGTLIDYTDDVSEYLFGISKRAVGGSGVDAIAANRGLPPNPSDSVRHDMERIRAHESQYGSGEFGGYTFATWHEIQAARLAPEQLAESYWRHAFELTLSLIRFWNLSDHQIRFVVWYDW